MKIDLKNLPIDLEVLHKIIISLVQKTVSLQEELQLLKAKRFGKSSEKLDEKISEIETRLEDSEEALGSIIVENEIPTKPVTKETAKRKALPEHLPREDVVLNPDPKCPECGGEEFRKLGDDISETLDYVPASFKVIRYIRPRCVCKNCDEVVQAYPASKTIAKGKAEPGLLSHTLVQKYCNHLPFYRQSQIYEREGIELSRATMAGWAAQCTNLLMPLVDELRKSIFTSSQLHGDDTPIKVLAPGLGKTKTGRIWTYVRDGRPFGDVVPPAVCYYYSPDRKGSRPEAHLKNYTGILHADAYAGYNKLYVKEDNRDATIEEAACWAHTRRKFYEITVSNTQANIALQVLDIIGKIYKIEAEIKGYPPDHRLEHRQSRSKSLVDHLFKWLQKTYLLLPKKSSTARAIYYALGNKDALMRFIDNGKIEIDNNAAERAMRSIAVGRKNWMFAGSDNGGHTAATMYSLIETAKMNGINPHLYLQKVLSVIQDYNSQKISELLPWNIELR